MESSVAARLRLYSGYTESPIEHTALVRVGSQAYGRFGPAQPELLGCLLNTWLRSITLAVRCRLPSASLR
jgi:hypothetical protein